MDQITERVMSLATLKGASISFLIGFLVFLIIPSSWEFPPFLLGGAVGVISYYILPKA